MGAETENDPGMLEGLLPTAITGAASLAMAGDITTTGANLNDELQGMADEAATNTAFTGYGVKTGLSPTETTIAADGSIESAVGPDSKLRTAGGNAIVNGKTGMQNAMTGLASAGTNANTGRFDTAMGNAAMMTGLSSGNGNVGRFDTAMGNAAAMNAYSSNNPNAAGAGGMLQGAMGGLAGQQAGALGASQQAMNNSMQDNGAREQEIYGRMMAAQQPGMDRARAGMEARAQAQGRGGISGSQYGGSGEQHAQSRAEAEARNSAMMGAMNQSQTEMMNQGQLSNMYGQMGQGAAGMQGNLANMYANVGAQNAQIGQGATALAYQGANQIQQAGIQNAQVGQGAAALAYQGANQLQNAGIQNAQLGQGAYGQMGNIGAQMMNAGTNAYNAQYGDMNAELGYLGAGATNADMSQTGQITGANLGAQLDLGGAQIEMNANKAASELYGNMFGAMAAPLGNLGKNMDDAGGFMEWLKNL